MCAAALVIRLLIAPHVGFYGDLRLFAAWSQRLATVGTHSFYSGKFFVDYPPGYLYILLVVGKLSRALGHAAPGYVALKLPSALGDLALAWVVGELAVRVRRPDDDAGRVRAIAMAAILFNPAVIAVGAVWGQVDVIPAVLVVAALLLFVTGRPRLRRDVAATVLFAAAVAMKPLSLVVIPVVALALWWRRIRGRPSRDIAPALAYCAALAAVGVLVLIATGLPFGLGPVALAHFYRTAASAYPVTSVWAFNLWGVYGFWRYDSAPNPSAIPTRLFGVPTLYVGLLLFAVGVVFILRRGYRQLAKGADFARVLLFAATAISVVAFAVLTRMHERYLFLSVACAAALVAYRRMRRGFALLSVLFVVNLYYPFVFQNADWNNSAAPVWVRTLRVEPLFRWVYGGFSQDTWQKKALSAITVVACIAIAVAGPRWVELAGTVRKRTRRLTDLLASAIPTRRDASATARSRAAGADLISVGARAAAMGPTVREPADGRWQRVGAFLRRVRTRHVLVALTVAVLAVGWLHAWPNLNRDFDHLHGWGYAQYAQLARMFAEQGVRHLGFAPAEYALHDIGDNYRYFIHDSPVVYLLLSVPLRLAPRGLDHLALRLTGMVTTVAFLAVVYALARRLRSRDFAAWVLFFAAVSAEVLFFGVFPSETIGALFIALAYCTYLGWRSAPRNGWPVLAIASLVAANLCYTVFAFPAALPILVDLALFDPAGLRRRRWTQMSLIALIPFLVFAALRLHYEVILPWLVSKPIWAADVGTTLYARLRYSLLVSPAFYLRLVWDAFRYVSPVGTAVAVAYVIQRLARVRRPQRRAPAASWQRAFIASTFTMVLFLLAFPKSALDHEFELFQLIVAFALLAGWFVVERGVATKAIAIIATIAMAFASTTHFSHRDNTPQWEFQTGVAIRLATPQPAFVRVPMDGREFYAMLLYYAHRDLLFDVPKRFRPVGVSQRFAVYFFPHKVPMDVAAIYSRPSNAVLYDAEPAARPLLPAVNRTYEGGRWRLLGAGITASYGPWRLVEIQWESARPTDAHLVIQVGEWKRRGWSALFTARLRGNTVDTSSAPTGTRFRDGFLVKAFGGNGIALQVFDERGGQGVHADDGALATPLSEVAPGS